MPMLKDLVQDVKAFGGTPLFVLLALLAFFLQEVVLSAQLVIGYLVSFAVTAIIRAAYFKERPHRRKHRTWVERIDASSFPSLHAMRAAVLAVVLGAFFASTVVSVLLALVAVGVGVVRVMQKRHYASDVVAGLVLGVVVGVVSLWLAGVLQANFI